MKAIVLDMDGTVADLYGVPGWLSMIEHKNAAPYARAACIGDMDKINGLLCALKGYGYTVEVVSWLAKGSTDKTFNNAVRRNKRRWLKKYLPAVDNVHIVAYGTNKWRVSNNKGGILFDDEQTNVDCWNKHTSSGKAVHVKNKNDVLRELECLVAECVAA